MLYRRTARLHDTSFQRLTDYTDSITSDVRTGTTHLMQLLPPTVVYDILFQAGDDTPAVIQVPDRTGTALDVTGWTAVAVVTANYAEVHRWSTFDGSAETGPDGVLLHADTSSDWEWTRGRYDLRVWAPDGTRRVVAVGDMLVRPVRST